MERATEKHAKKRSIHVKVPRQVINAEPNSNGEEEESKASDFKDFVMNDEVLKLIRRYKRKWLLLYNTQQIEELEASKLLGSVYQYIF